MSRDEQKPVALGRDALIFGRRELDRLETRRLPALTVKWQRPLDVVLLGAFLDLLVDAAEDLLVPRRAFREVHLAPALESARGSAALFRQPGFANGRGRCDDPLRAPIASLRSRPELADDPVEDTELVLLR